MGAPDRGRFVTGGREAACEFSVVYESPHTRVVRFRGTGHEGTGHEGTGGSGTADSGSGAGTIWKEPLGASAGRRQQRELAILAKLAHVPGVPKVVQSSGGGAGFGVVDRGGLPLSEVLADPGRGGRGVVDRDQLCDLLAIMVELASVLVEVHAEGVVHKDINPFNILVIEPAGEVVLIDWDLATAFAEEQSVFGHENRMAGTLAYLAPEQTGRTSFGVDQRTDLYGLGATLYEGCTGRPPLGLGDALSLVHHVLARTPDPVDTVNPVVPRALADVIGRLLAKAPDDRYQSASGLAHDLRRILTDIRAGREPRLSLGAQDVSSRFTPPSRLVGRDREIARMEDVLEAALGAGGQLLLVSGPPGEGKTSLIDQLRPLIAARNGWFVQGKFDQFRRDGDGDAVRQAMGELARLLLAEPEQRLVELREQLLPRLGPDVGLLTGVVPDLAPVLSVPPGRPDGVDSAQLATRLVQAGGEVVRAVASPQRPLVMFLDDLQWAGEVPISLLDVVVTRDGPAGFLLVAAYRDDEVSPSHPLTAALARWSRLGCDPVRLQLQPLPKEAVATLVAEMLRRDPADDDVRELAQILLARTDGNAFETIELVTAAHREDLFRPGAAGWTWEPDALRRHVSRDGAGGNRFATRIEALPAASVGVLDALACLGGVVDLDLLAAVCGLDARAVDDAVQPCLADGLLVAVQDGATTSVRFRHDRVREGVHARRDPSNRRGTHLTLARRLLDLGRDGPAAEHYLAAATLVTEPGERRRVARLFAATANAIRLVNQSTAERLLAAGQQLLAGLDDPSSRQLATRLMIDRHAALFNLARFDEADDLYRLLRQSCTDPVALATASGVQITSVNHRGRPNDAVDLALDQLTALGFVPPTQEKLPACNRAGLAALDAWISEGPRPGETDRAEATDPGARAAAVLIERAVPAAWYLNHPLMPWLTFLTHQLWVEHGPCPALMSCFGGAGMTGINLRGDFRLGYEVNRRVLAVGQARGWQPDTAQLRNTHTNFGIPYFEPIEHVIQEALIARERLLRCGEVQYASFTYVGTLWAALDCQPTLDAIETELASATTFWTHTGYLPKVMQYTGYRQLLRCLRGRTAGPGDFTDPEYSDEAYLRDLGRDRVSLLYYHLVKALAAGLFNDLDQAGVHADAAMHLADAAPGMYLWTTVRLLTALSCEHRIRGRCTGIGGHSGGSSGGRGGERPCRECDGLAERASEQLRWLESRAVDAPDNFAHLASWLRAERAWTQRRFDAAARAFDEALNQAMSQAPSQAPSQAGGRRPWHTAMITERAGRMYADDGKSTVALLFLGQAVDLYSGWGAVAKVQALVREFPALGGRVARPVEQSGQSGPGTGHPTGSGGKATSVGSHLERSIDLLRGSSSIAVHSDEVDLMAVLRASQALSGETNLDRLRTRLVEVLGAMTGATTVQLALWNDDAKTWFLTTQEGGGPEGGGPEGAQAPSGQSEVRPLPGESRPAPAQAEQLRVDDEAAAGLVCRSALRYVERTGEPLLVVDATRDDRFREDPYLAGVKRSSLLVLPIVFRGRPRAAVFLENRLTRGVFSESRLDAVKLVAGQLAVSLDNALAERFRALVHRSSDLTLVCDRQTRITYASQAARGVLGAIGSQVVGNLVPDLAHPDDREHVRQWLDDGAVEPALECRLAEEESGQRWVEISGTDLTRDPAVAGLVLRLRDVTRRRRLEAELRQAHKLESMGQLAAGVAHEINTPIQFITGNLTFIGDSLSALGQLLDGYHRAITEEVSGPELLRRREELLQLEEEVDAEFLRSELPQATEQASDGARRVARIVAAMKSFTHPGGREQAAADINQAIRTALIMGTNEVKSVADVVLDLAQLPPVWCCIDDINQAILNLIVNAAQAMAEAQAAGSPRGVLTVRSRAVENQVEVEISDTGNGIPPEIADRVFDQFFTTKPVGTGTGQGLALAYAIIHDRHRGSLWFTSEPGVGTTFHLQLPISAQQ